MAGRVLGWGLALLAAGIALGCGSGPMTLVGYAVPAREQVAIVIDISEQVNQADQTGGVATLAETIAERLKAHGMYSQFYTSKYDHPTAPRVDVFVSQWQGPAAPEAKAAVGLAPLGAAFGLMGAAVAAGGTYNKIVVDCRVSLPGQDKPVFSQHFEESGFGADGNASAESAGDAIANAILTR